MSTILQPPSFALIGMTGAGKTYSIATLLKAGLNVGFLGTEPNAVEVLLQACRRQNISTDELHYHQLNVVAPGWGAIFDNITQVGAMSYESLTTVKGISKDKMRHFMELAQQCKNFQCQRTGKDLGDVTSWDNSWAFVIDSLSGINKMAREYVVGYRPTMHMGEWGVAMQLEENLLYKLISDRKCFFILIAHVDREVDELSGGTLITMAALGKKLAPQLLKYFSEVVYAKRDGKEFVWSTADVGVTTKQRSLEISNKLPPSFETWVASYRNMLSGFEKLSPGAQVVVQQSVKP